MHGVQSFIKGHRKSGVISIKHSRDMTNRISPLTIELGQCYNIQKRASECKEHRDLLTSFNSINGVISLIFIAG